MMKKRHLPFWLIIISAFFIMVIRDLFRDGMFMDGMLYVTVAHNLANGLGTFWHPNFSQTSMSVFHEQPPLMFGIEALFFKLLGSSMYVERIYELIVALITAFLICKLWDCFFSGKPENNLAWLPVLFWHSVPVCCWAFVNNVEEPTMGMFELGGMLFICKSFAQNNKTFLNLGIAALMIFGASLCKGFQGLFPLGAIFLYWAVFRKISFTRMMAQTVFLLALIVAFYGIILLNETVRSSFTMYFNRRIIVAFTDSMFSGNDRFGILKRLFSELIPAFILLLGGTIFFRLKKMNLALYKNNRQIALWFFLVALSGTLPLMLTLEQSGFYFVPALPYFAMGFATLLSPFVSKLIEQINTGSMKFKLYRSSTWLILAVAVVFSLFTIIYIPKRDNQMLHDVSCTGTVITKGSVIGIPAELESEWSLLTYFSRYYFISLDASSARHKYFLFENNLDRKLIPEGYEPVNLPTQKYDLYVSKRVRSDW